MKNAKQAIEFLDWYLSGDEENSCPMELYKKHNDNEITTEELYQEMVNQKESKSKGGGQE